MRRKTIYFISIAFLIFLFGCNTPNGKEEVSPLHENKYEHLQLTPSKTVVEKLKNNENIKNVHAVNNDKEILVVFTTDSLDRFQLNEIEKEVKEITEKSIDDRKVHVSTDEKIILEIEKLNKKIKDETISKDHLNKKVKELIELSKEQT